MLAENNLTELDLCLRSRSDVQAINARRTWVIEQLSAFIRNGAIPKDDAWVQAVLDWLTVHGLFIVRKQSDKSEFLAVRFYPTAGIHLKAQ